MPDERLEEYVACPFCGEKSYLQLKYTVGQDIVKDKADYAAIRCSKCCVRMFAVAEPEHFVPYGETEHEDCYKKIPTKYAEEVLKERWNTRAEIEDEPLPEEIELDPETGDISLIIP